MHSQKKKKIEYHIGSVIRTVYIFSSITNVAQKGAETTETEKKNNENIRIRQMKPSVIWKGRALCKKIIRERKKYISKRRKRMTTI